MRIRNRNCWICDTPAIGEDGVSLEPFELSVALQAVAHQRCLPLAELARRSVYKAEGEKLGPNRRPKLHLRTSGSGNLLFCKHTAERMRRLGAVRDFGGVIAFSAREDACAVCARELATQIENVLGRARRLAASVRFTQRRHIDDSVKE